MKKYFQQFISLIIILLLVTTGVILAGNISTSETPDTNFYTLSDIYNKLTDSEYSYEAHTNSYQSPGPCIT